MEGVYKKPQQNIFSLAIKYFSLIVKLLIVLTVVSCFFYIYSSIQELKNEEINKITNASSLINRAISSNAGYAKYQLYYIAKQLSKAGGNKDKINQILSGYKTNINNDFDVVTTWNMFSWIDTKGQLSVDGFEGILTRPVDMNNRDYLPVTKLDPGKIITGKPIIGAISRRLIVPIAIGVVDDRGRYLGTIVFGIDLGKLVSKIELTAKDNPSQFFIIDGDKKLIFKSSTIDEEKINSLIDKMPQGQALDLINHTNKIYSFDTLFAKITKAEDISGDTTGVYVGVVNNDALFSANFRNMILQKLLICLTITLFITLFLAKIYYRVLRPIKILCDYSNNIINKKYNTVSFEDIDAEEFKDLYRALSLIEHHIEIEESLKKQLSYTHQHLQSLTRSISHDLRNYIFSISGLVSLILDGRFSKHAEQNQRLKDNGRVLDKEELDILRTIVQQSEEAGCFIEDLLDDNQIQSGNFTLGKIIECDIALLMKKVILTSQTFAKDHKVTLVSEIENNLPFLKCDPRRMKQIFMNLISNAIKYNKENGEVKIKLCRGNYLCPPILCKDLGSQPGEENLPYIYIEILDSGIGMTADEVVMALKGDGKNIDKSGLNKKIPLDSHGIGMSIIKHLVDLHQGKIEIESEKNVGTMVKLWFRIDNSNQNKEQNLNNKNLELSADSKSANSKLVVLIVDDNPVNLMIVKGVLNQEHYQVIKANNGQEALETLDKHPEINLVILDGQMPIMDGYETAKAIRSGVGFDNFTNYNIPIIALMGDDDEETLRKAKECGMNDHIKKSASVVNLIALVEYYLSLKSSINKFSS